jgi:hypothetical protein
VKNACRLSIFVKPITLPSQARDKQMESWEKRRFSQGGRIGGGGGGAETPLFCSVSFRFVFFSPAAFVLCKKKIILPRQLGSEDKRL